MARRQGTELGEPGEDEGAAPRAGGSKGSGAGGSKGSGTPGRPGETPAGLPEGLRRLIALGLSTVFTTQESLRQTVGDALPKEWVDFAVDQSDRTRQEFLERLATELARAVENIDLAKVMQQALEGRTLEVHARIRMLPDDEEAGSGGGLRISMREDDDS